MKTIFEQTADRANQAPGRPARIKKVIAWLRPSCIMGKLNNIVATNVPVGYEDEMGFHLGVKTAPVPFVPENLY